MLSIQRVFPDRKQLTGVIFILISFLIYCIPFLSTGLLTNTFGFFFVNFVFAVIYFIMAECSGTRGPQYRILLLTLFLISAYSLNREIEIFQKSTQWFSCLLVIICVNMGLFSFFEKLPVWMRHVYSFILGISFIVFIYLAIYLLPLYVFSAAAFFALGISLHTFVPILLCLLIIALIKRAGEHSKKYWISFSSGAGISVTIVLIFTICWSHYLKEINNNYRYSSIEDSNGMPSWVKVAEHLHRNTITEKIMKTGLVYDIPDAAVSDLFWRVPRRNFGEEIKHDPLIMIASFINGQLFIPDDQRIKILESMYDSRHQAQERLWSGKDLETERIDGDIRLWPELRVAYTELNITVTNSPDNNSWNNQQEAIYTFHLPEGGVVTSLSLWIAGKEEKGILTTKEKADSAYKTIVGVENRDPSVVHWQEGNTVSVRVFPILKGESRKFKLGITAPLTFQQNQLTYENIYFDGPSASSATQNIIIHSGKTQHHKTGQYNPDWNLSLPVESITEKTFSFDGSTYSVQPYDIKREPFNASSVYLDINASWDSSEFNAVYDLVKTKTVFVSGGRNVTASNKDSLFNELSKKEFSVFPFFEISENSSSLVISKSAAFSPSVDDLRESEFLQNLQRYFQDGHRIRLFNLGNNLSPYLKSLKEFRTLSYEQGNLKDLQLLLNSNSFAANNENEDQVIIDNAAIAIQRTDGIAPSTAPDHLMRLFTYNHILQQSGNGLINGSVTRPDLVEEAKKAYVVSPVSSLVVLETRKDYERFDISSSKNSLQNATANSKGAVPEPHEWALIFIVIAMIVVFKYRFL